MDGHSDAELIDAIEQLGAVMACAQRQLLRFVAEYDTHHIVHWASEHRETNEANLITVCLYHHHFLHGQHWSSWPPPGGC